MKALHTHYKLQKIICKQFLLLLINLKAFVHNYLVYSILLDVLLFLCNRDKALIFLEDIATQQVFKPWEISDQLPRLRYELSTIPETTRVMELLHKAAYRTGLGYSLYSPKRQLGRISTETVRILLHINHKI